MGSSSIGKVVSLSTGVLAFALIAALAYGPASNAASPTTSGKALVAQYHCAGCHGDKLSGKSGVLKGYTIHTFATVLAKGVKKNGQLLKGMPVLHASASRASAIYSYLLTAK